MSQKQPLEFYQYIPLILQKGSPRVSRSRRVTKPQRKNNDKDTAVPGMASAPLFTLSAQCLSFALSMFYRRSFLQGSHGGTGGINKEALVAEAGDGMYEAAWCHGVQTLEFGLAGAS